MIRAVYIGMDLRVLEALCDIGVELAGVYLPMAPYGYITDPPWFLKLLPRFFIKKKLKTASVFAGLANTISKRNLKSLQANSVNGQQFLALLEQCKPDIGIVANFGEILRKPLLSFLKHGFINYHPSLLPKYRGPTPIGHILLNRETISGATWHQVSEKPDHGDILAQDQFDINPHDKMSDLEERSVKTAIDLLPQLLSDITRGRIRPMPQIETQASYFPKLSKQEKQKLSEMGKLAE